MLKEISPNIWILDGATVPWYGMPYTTRTTIIRLCNGDLWVHSPGKICEDLLEELNALGQVQHLVSPNKIHHLFLQDWRRQYPDSQLYASPGLSKKRKDIEFDKELKDQPEEEWKDEIDQLIFTGSLVMEEVVFFHKPSETLILTDLIENFPPEHFSGFQKILAQMTGIISPNGKTPIDWRFSFLFGKKKARGCFHRILAWKPNKIIIAHGECVFKNTEEFLKRSFKWLQ